MNERITPQLGLAALRAYFKEGSPLGPLKVMAKHIGRFFQIPLPMFRPYVVFGPEANRKVLVTERQKVLWRNPDPVTDVLRRGVLIVDGREHDRYRELMEPALHPGKVPDYAEMMLAQTERVTAQWRDDETIDMLVEGRKIALLIIMNALFSVDAWNDLPHTWTPILKAVEFISPGPWIFWRKIPRPGYRKHLQQLDEYLCGIIRDRRGAPAKPDLLQHLIDAGLDDNLIRDQMLTMLIAGHDTSTALLAWTFALLGQHSDVYARLVQELDALEKSPLLDQVIKESLRLYPPIHIGNRIVAADLEFPEGSILAGSRMFYSIYLTHRDPAIWENADQFCPERFSHGSKKPPFAYVPFGGGPRACVGSAFGQAEARLVIARLLRNFSFEFMNAGRIRAHMGATLEPRPGVLVKIQRRPLFKRELHSVKS
ncbi:MAG TPA: cytochrome P450 [Anaerolineales bacterium]|nr:cytochrome P450 [Anaerolineales bacterium]